MAIVATNQLSSNIDIPPEDQGRKVRNAPGTLMRLISIKQHMATGRLWQTWRYSRRNRFRAGETLLANEFISWYDEAFHITSTSMFSGPAYEQLISQVLNLRQASPEDCQPPPFYRAP